jgi:queuine tRNA-ribosyltransferase
MSFTIEKTDPSGKARTGLLALGHGTVRTPCFMPVGTNGSVKAMRNAALEEMGISLILGNTYHLYLRPGTEVIAAAGGLHGFMGWKHNILTDSGGYQVFSLSPFRKIRPEGVVFKSHLDGSTHTLSPEGVIGIQGVLGSDVLMPLDVCTAPGIPRAEAAEAVELTRGWLARSKTAWQGLSGTLRGQLFGIMQGNFFADLRRESAAGIVELDLPGYAIGGLSVGEEFSVFRDFTHSSAELLPVEKPRYLMGIGTPEYILEAVEAGIDLFDCVFPTRTARNAMVFTPRGTMNLRNEAFKKDFSPIDGTCACETCRTHSRAYLRHLFKAKEIQAAVLATCHNLAFIQTLVAGIRRAITSGCFPAYKKEFLAGYAGGESS